MRTARGIGKGLALAAALACAATPACDGDSDWRRARARLLEDERNTVDVFHSAADSVVFVTNTERRRDLFTLNAMEVRRGSGSGFVWDDVGHIVTNFHVVQGGNRFAVTLSDGSNHEAEVVGVAPRKDIAVLKIDAAGIELSPIHVGDSSELIVGQKVLAIGNPFGLDGSLSTGVVSALGRQIENASGTLIEDVIQTDASINPGNSGGPLLDSSGNLIGITTAIYSPTGASSGVGFAVPVTTVTRIVPQLVKYGRVKWPGLGITALPDHVAARWGVEGVIVRSVLEGSPADRAGLKGIEAIPGGRVRSFDLITRVGDRPIRRALDLVDALGDHDPGDVVRIEFLREGELWEANVELGELK